MKRPRGPKQTTLESTLGRAAMSSPAKRQKKARPGAASSPLPARAHQAQLAFREDGPPPHFMPRDPTQKRFVNVDDSSESSDSAKEENEVIDEDDLPLSRGRRSYRKATLADDSSSTASAGAHVDDLPSLSPKARKRKLPSEDSDEDSDDMPIATPASALRRRRQPRAVIVLDDEEDDGGDKSDDSSRPVKRRRLARKAPSSPAAHGSNPPQAATGSGASTPKDADGEASESLFTPAKKARSARKGPRSEKKKQMELLRRRRLGQKIDEDDLSSSEEEEQAALYDSDPDNPALSEFEDDEEPPPPSSPLGRAGKAKEAKAKKAAAASANKEKSHSDGGDANSDDEMDDFIDDDDDGPMGAPDDLRAEIPLEFTVHAHKPLKSHFKDAVEWLVQRRINPNFDKGDAVYKLAWRKLNDEVQGLAQSKFMSSGWKREFLLAVRARPYMDSYELERGNPLRMDTCEACGRTNHPATWKIKFDGSAYYRETLEDVDSDDSDEDNGDELSVDEDNNPLQPTSKEWFVGVVCNSNAQTAHNLMHWKRALMDWVEDKLKNEGWFKPAKLKERDSMKTKKKRELANEIVDRWEANGTLKRLYSDFKENLEQARNKSTTGRMRYGRG